MSEDYRIKNILVPLDGSKNSIRGLEKAIYLAREHEASLVFIHVLQHKPTRVKPRLGMKLKLEEPTFMLNAKKSAEKNMVRSNSRILSGDPGHKIIEYADTHKVDLIVLGARGQSQFKEVFLGSVSHYVLQKAKVAVMIVR